jgi:hypothetical protein
MSNNDFLYEILSLRQKCLSKIDEDNNELINLHKQLLKWQKQIINELEKFIEEKYHEIKQKYFETNRQFINHLDNLYTNSLTNNINQNYSKLFEDFNKLHLSIDIYSSKQIDFNQYIQLNTNHLNDIQRSLILINNKNSLNLSSYQHFSTLSIQSNLTSLFSTYDRLLVYYDHYTSSASLHIFDLQNYLKQSNNNRSCLKLRVPCNQFQGKIMHIEYCSYLQGFLLATSSKLFLLEIPNKCTNYNVTEYFDIVHGKFPGILQKFACHPTTPNLIYLLINTFSHYTLVQIDLSKTSYIQKSWDYPIDDNDRNDSLIPTTTTDDNITKFNSQITTINDFALGKNLFIFVVTYQSSKLIFLIIQLNYILLILDDNSSYQFHIRSSDMNLQYRFILNSTFRPLHICMLPCDYSSSSWNEQEQFLIIFEKSKLLSLYHINPTDQIQLIDEIVLNTEPEYIGFANNNLSILLIRNLFHIAIYQQMDTNISLPIRHHRSSDILHQK